MRKMQAGSFAELVKMAASLGTAASNDTAMDAPHAHAFALAERHGFRPAASYGHA